MSIGELIAKDHALFGIGPRLGPSSRNRAGGLKLIWSFPVTQIFFALEAVDDKGVSYYSLEQLPITRPGFPIPEKLPAQPPVCITLQEPIQFLPLTSGELWLPIIGQLFNATAAPLTLEKWQFRITNQGNTTVLNRDLTSTFRLTNNTKSLIDFPYFFPLPDTFKKGKLIIRADLTITGQRHSISREAEITRAEPARLHPPVAGIWRYNNGPGELMYHPHYHYPSQRYAYDLNMQKQLGQGRRTFEGDPEKNESYFAWNQPIRAVADGTVVEVADDVPDNFGRKPNPARPPARNGEIVIEHPGSKFSFYGHVKQGSATVKVGRKVKAGDILARIGNAGISTEPHLHFQYNELDATGRHQAVPVQFTGLKSIDGRALLGVPKGATEYRTD